MAFDPNKITFFARTDARGRNVDFGIKAKDRQRHVYVIGKTGMGKSTLLENMAVQDIQNGEGMAFIDPHGSAAETLLKYIPEHRVKDVLYFAPFDTDYPISFNIMEDVGEDKRHLVVSGLMSVFKKIWVDAWSARMEYILSNVLLALLEYPDSTLLGVNRMLSDKAYRDLVVANVKDPGVRAFWLDEFAKYNERYMQEAGDAIKNKIGQFTSNPIIRHIVGQPKSSFDIRKIMDEQKIMIINLSKGLIGESNANLLGSMLTTRIYLAAMSRADLPPEKMREMPNFYFFVDEFQSFANATFANILSEARKYHLNLTIAHQYITQMEEEVRDAVFGNVGTIISFRVGPLDAEFLETVFTPQFLATDIVNLSFAQVYLTLMIDGIGSPPFSATTLPPIAPPTISYRDVVIASSREKFTQPRAVVEEMIHKFHEPIVVPKKVVAKPIIPEQVIANGERSRPPRPANGNIDVPKYEPRVERPLQATPRVASAPAHANGSGYGNGNGNGNGHNNGNGHGHGSNHAHGNGGKSFRPGEHARPPVRHDHAPHAPQSRPHMPPKEKVEQTPAPVVEDLRAVLKRMAEKEGVSSEPVHSTPKVEEKQSKHADDLRNVLASMKAQNMVMTEQDTNEHTETETSAVHNVSEETVAPTISVEESQSPAAGVSVPSSRQDIPETQSQKIEVATAVAQDHSRDTTRRVTPKELERMMRVTTNDKPPV